jgi:acyl-CoA synthetase (AMP-forming)/AMP-acid ligase II
MTQYDPNTLTGLLAEKGSACPEAPALEYRDSLITFKGLEEQGRRVAGGLRAMGVERGDRAALWLLNVPAYVVLCFALARLGATAVAVNTRYWSMEVEDIVGRSRARCWYSGPYRPWRNSFSS